MVSDALFRNLARIRAVGNQVANASQQAATSAASNPNTATYLTSAGVGATDSEYLDGLTDRDLEALRWLRTHYGKKPEQPGTPKLPMPTNNPTIQKTAAIKGLLTLKQLARNAKKLPKGISAERAAAAAENAGKGITRRAAAGRVLTQGMKKPQIDALKRAGTGLRYGTWIGGGAYVGNKMYQGNMNSLPKQSTPQIMHSNRGFY